MSLRIIFSFKFWLSKGTESNKTSGTSFKNIPICLFYPGILPPLHFYI